MYALEQLNFSLSRRSALLNVQIKDSADLISLENPYKAFSIFKMLVFKYLLVLFENHSKL